MKLVSFRAILSARQRTFGTSLKKRAKTMADIAELANVSKPTVSRALSNSPLVNEATRDHVLAVAAEHGYAVNRNAQKLRHKRTNTIAVSMDFRSHRENHISDPFMFDLLAGVSEALGRPQPGPAAVRPQSQRLGRIPADPERAWRRRLHYSRPGTSREHAEGVRRDWRATRRLGRRGRGRKLLRCRQRQLPGGSAGRSILFWSRVDATSCLSAIPRSVSFT